MRRLTILFVAALSLVGAALPNALAQSGGAAPEADRRAEEMLSAVVRVRMKAIDGARSNASLGATREGSGVVINEDGYIVTIGYVVMEASAIEVVTQDNRVVPARLAAYDHASGFGLLRALAPLNVTPMKLGQSAELQQREPVMVLPAGGREAASVAYVVSKRRFTGSWEYLLESAIFTSPPTMQWAGAALVNKEGLLVGIGSLLVRETAEPGTALPGNMFVPIDELKPILPDLIAKGRRAEPPRPWLGVATEELQGRLFVTRVSPESPADKAGMRAGDIVLGVGGQPVRNHVEFYERVWARGAAGASVPLRVLQGAEMKDITVRSIDRFDYFKERPTY